MEKKLKKQHVISFIKYIAVWVLGVICGGILPNSFQNFICSKKDYTTYSGIVEDRITQAPIENAVLVLTGYAIDTTSKDGKFSLRFRGINPSANNFIGGICECPESKILPINIYYNDVIYNDSIEISKYPEDIENIITINSNDKNEKNH